MLLYEFKVHLLLNPARTVYLQFPEHRDCTCPFEVKAVGCVQRKLMRRTPDEDATDFCQLQVSAPQAGVASILAEQFLTLLDEAAPALGRDDLFIEVVDASVCRQSYFIADCQKVDAGLILSLAWLTAGKCCV